MRYVPGWRMPGGRNPVGLAVSQARARNRIWFSKKKNPQTQKPIEQDKNPEYCQRVSEK